MTRDDVHVAVIGAGMAGMQMALDLKRRGYSYTVYEKGNDVGGTWRENTYPGLFVDVPVSMYKLTFAEKYDWSHAFAAGSEIQDYLVQASHDSDLRTEMRFGVEISDLTWTGDHWSITTSSGEIEQADAVVCATGFLHHPQLPTIDGMASFAGEAFHSSAWPADLDTRGKRIGVVGTGSSGIQLVAALAYMGCEVTQFVRTPQYVETITNPRANPIVRLAARLLGRRFPAVGRFAIANLLKKPHLDPRLKKFQWRLEPGPERLEAQEALREDVREIREPGLRARLTPDFEPGCKRIPKSPAYFAAVAEPNVEVVLGPIERITPQGVVGGDGRLHELDVLVYATGYRAHSFMRPIRVIGQNGRSIDDAWADGVFAYKTVSVPGFPNLWVMNGPFSPIASPPPPPFAVSRQAKYILDLLEFAAAEGVATAPSETASKQFLAGIAQALPSTVWAGDCDNWYKGSGAVPVVWPYDQTTYLDMFDRLDIDDLERVPLATGVDRSAAGSTVAGA